MIDAVLSYHLNPQTCGVAKFNHALAERLGVPVLRLNSTACTYPLISIKGSELPRIYENHFHGRFDLFLHDAVVHSTTLRNARRVYAGNQVIADAVSHLRDDVTVAFCPSTVQGNPHRGTYNVLVFGMAHKLLLTHFAQLKATLDTEHPDYTVSLSTAVHEGSPWDAALTESVDAMRGIFGDRLRVLGYLGDDALAKELHECDAVAAYYVPALRANNTSAWAALEAGKTLYTNTDEHSPALDAKAHSWDKLLEIVRA